MDMGELEVTRSKPGLQQVLRKLGVWGFVFFLVKGLLWLAIPAAIAAWSAK